MVYIILTAILILPWLIIPNNHYPDCTRLIKAVAFDFTMMAIIVYALINGLNFKYKNKYLGYLTAWVFITFGFNWYYPLLVGYGYNAGTIDSNIHYILSVVATIFVCSQLEGEDFYKITKATAISIGLVCLFCFLQIIGLDPVGGMVKYISKEQRHIAAFLDHPDIVGNYIAICFPFLLYLTIKERGINILLLVLALFVLFFVHSSISTVAVIISSLVFLFLSFRHLKYARRMGTCLMGILFLFCFLNPHFSKIDTGFTGRIPAWQEMLHRCNNITFGQGLGIVKSYMVKQGDNYWMFAHNDYLEVMFSLGLVGLFLFLLVVINSFKNFVYKKQNILGFSFLASFIAFLIVSFGSFPMEIAPLALGGLVAFWGVEKLG